MLVLCFFFQCLSAVIVQSANGFLNKGLAGVSCSVIHMNNWSEIILRRYISQTASVDVLSVTADGSLTWHDLSLTSRAISNFRFTSMEAVLEIWIFVLKCADEGAYTCTVNGPTHLKDGHAVLKVYGRPCHHDCTFSVLSFLTLFIHNLIIFSSFFSCS